GIMHILIFAGFIVLVIHTISLFLPGTNSESTGTLAVIYGFVVNYAATLVFFCVIAAAVRRLMFKPARYDRSADAIFLLGLIALVMAADSAFEASRAAGKALQGQPAEAMAFLSLPWLCQTALAGLPLGSLKNIYFSAYLVHQLAFFFLLCYR